MSERFKGDKGKWTSHRKTWTIDKSFDGSGVHIDIEKRVIRMNPKHSWVRFESENLIHVYEWLDFLPESLRELVKQEQE